jgi:hypothetical protein
MECFLKEKISRKLIIIIKQGETNKGSDISNDIAFFSEKVDGKFYFKLNLCILYGSYVLSRLTILLFFKAQFQ